jgi:4-diphosphocytidyl-2-C-methyl-D-erythritol kinase
MTAMQVRAHAKLTWTLRVVGVRDDGYHLIDAEMVTLDLHDVLTIEPGGDGIVVTGPFAAGVPTGADNLAARALAVTARRARITIDKRIPHGGGLGGGSADAAAVLRWAGVGDLDVAARLGADVPFCVVGGRARVTGIGERVELLPHLERDVTLVIPPLAVSTPAAYRAWDDLGGPRAGGPNDLEPAAIAAVPELAHWRDRITAACGVPPVLAGSGATWFVEGRHSNALAELRGEGATVVAARTCRPD